MWWEKGRQGLSALTGDDEAGPESERTVERGLDRSEANCRRNELARAGVKEGGLVGTDVAHGGRARADLSEEARDGLDRNGVTCRKRDGESRTDKTCRLVMSRFDAT